MTDCNCQPDCCQSGITRISATVGGSPLFDASCCPKAMAYIPANGMVVAAGEVVFFTGSTKTVTIDGQAVTLPEVTKTGPAQGIAGIAMWAIDNTANNVGSTQFLVNATVFANRITLNGATLAQLKQAGITVSHVYQ